MSSFVWIGLAISCARPLPELMIALVTHNQDVSQSNPWYLNDLFCISMSRGWEIRFPKSHGSYPDNVCKLQLYGTYMYVIIGCKYLSGLDCHFFFLTLNTPSWKFMNASFALSLLMSWCQTTVHHQQQCFICDRYMNFIIKKKTKKKHKLSYY